MGQDLIHGEFTGHRRRTVKIAEDDALYPGKQPRLVQLIQHPVHPVRVLTGILQKQDGPVAFQLIGRAAQRGQNRQIAAL